MEGVYSDVSSSSSNSSKAPKLKSLTGDVSPINVAPQRFIGSHGHGRGRCRYHPLPNSPIFDPYASPDSPNSPLIRYLRSAGSATSGGRTPLASVENFIDAVPPVRSPAAMFSTPVKVEEDVLVMDGILVNHKTNTSRVRPSLMSSNSGGRSSSSASSSSGGKETNSSSFNKTDTCRSWEESGSCRFGAKCLFVHGKEELRVNSTRLPSKNKVEAQICKAYSSGSCTYGTKCRFVHHHQVKSTVQQTQPQVQPAIAMTLPMMPESVSPIKLEHPTSSSSRSRSRSSTPIGFTSSDWSPMDDAIEVTLPTSASLSETNPSKEDVDEYIHSVLHGPARRKRLQVFAEICPDLSA